jgi:hypothetical protein
VATPMVNMPDVMHAHATKTKHSAAFDCMSWSGVGDSVPAS